MHKIMLSLSFFFFKVLIQRIGEKILTAQEAFFLTESISLNTLHWQGHLLFRRRFLQQILWHTEGHSGPQSGSRVS